ncbi:hypothetical protein CBL_05175, partial [Carabus blaptoides fortunei]
LGDESLEEALENAYNEIQDVEEEEINSFIDGELSSDEKIDILQQQGKEIFKQENINRFTCPKRIKEKDLFKLMINLNVAQREIVMHILNCFNTNKADPLKKILSGSAGVVSQFGGQMPELSADLANNIREKLFNLKLLIIDEVSMVGSTFLSRVDTRLRQIMDSKSIAMVYADPGTSFAHYSAVLPKNKEMELMKPKFRGDKRVTANEITTNSLIEILTK